ncbi:unnamed protein product [Blepharisma stoltei]|uniref:dual-specificity kinase n=1 Tax=Blepharisma stoltei TaxID=1481888 RepID=A0AAU9KMI5_9CILI|nr:unnamed protein product [Blepharisma stoltei]
MNKYKLQLRLDDERKGSRIPSVSKKQEITPNPPKLVQENHSLIIQKTPKSSRVVPTLPIGKFLSSTNGWINQHSTSRSILPSSKNSSQNTTLISQEESNFSNSSILAPKLLNQTPKNISKIMNSTQKKMKENISDSPNELKLPLSGISVLKQFKSYLNDWEQGEILDYNVIYYIGKHEEKSSSGVGPNHGFDDERGDYKFTIGEHICYRYEISQQLGKGSFGQVFKAYDHKVREFVALKIIRNKTRFHQQGAVEVKILKSLKEYDAQDRYNIVHIKDHFVFRNHLCISFELLSINLYDFLKSNNFQGLSLPLIRRFAYQILQCLKVSNRLGVIHCDLKPENILLKHSNKSSLKVIDFGSSCYENQKLYTYIQSRFYRAPEIMLGIPYTSAIDIWSFGCILVELYTGSPLFAGESEIEQFQCIMEVKGMPPYNVLQQGTRVKMFFDASGYPKITTNSRGRRRYPSSRDLKEILHGTDALFQDFIEKCLEWDPAVRIKAEEALRHPWIVDGASKIPVASTTPKSTEIVKPVHKQKRSFEIHAKSARNSHGGSFLF